VTTGLSGPRVTQRSHFPNALDLSLRAGEERSATSDSGLAMEAAYLAGRNPEPSSEGSRECALGVVADRCRHLRKGDARRGEALMRET